MHNSIHNNNNTHTLQHLYLFWFESFRNFFNTKQKNIATDLYVPSIPNYGSELFSSKTFLLTQKIVVSSIISIYSQRSSAVSSEYGFHIMRSWTLLSVNSELSHSKLYVLLVVNMFVKIVLHLISDSGDKSWSLQESLLFLLETIISFSFMFHLFHHSLYELFNSIKNNS